VFGFEIKEKETFDPQLWTQNVRGSSINQEIINIQGLPNRTQKDLLPCCLHIYIPIDPVLFLLFFLRNTYEVFILATHSLTPSPCL
jgi:hypothetical protein